MARLKRSFTVSREQALRYGMLTCKNCRRPINNHFDWGKRPSAHDPNCKEYVEVVRKL